MASSNQKIITLSAALTALVAPAAGHATLTPPEHGDAQRATERPVRPTVNLPVGEELMSFTVGETDKGMVVADHSSHASHSSHSSHSSHYSGR